MDYLVAKKSTLCHKTIFSMGNLWNDYFTDFIGLTKMVVFLLSFSVSGSYIKPMVMIFKHYIDLSDFGARYCSFTFLGLSFFCPCY